MAEQTTDTRRDRALIVEDDPAVLEVLRGILAVEGFEVRVCPLGEDAVRYALEWHPDVVLLDVMMPGADGISVCRRLRHDFGTGSMCIVMVTARVSLDDKLIGLQAGADDYVTKPFDPEELVGRVRAAIRRCRDRTSLNPLTELPGNLQIHQAIRDALAWEEPFALLHIDIDSFKAFNDHYNVLRGDQAIRLLAECIREVVKASGAERAFVGHVGGDDFAVVIEAQAAESVARQVIRLWNQRVPALYEVADLERGFIRVRDRQLRTARFPVMTLSIGIASSEQRRFVSHLEAADIAAEMKQVAKRDPASTYAIDRRQGVAPSALRRDPRSVMLVDDWDDIREVLRLHCEQLGFNVVAEADDGVMAVDLAERHLPAFVILDQRMPRMDGDSAAKAIRAAVAGVTIIAFSAFLDEKPEWADEFLRKEQINELTPMLGRYLEERVAARSPAGPEAV